MQPNDTLDGRPRHLAYVLGSVAVEAEDSLEIVVLLTER